MNSEFKTTPIGMFPQSWSFKKLGDIIELIHGYQFRSYDFTDNGIPVIKIGNVIGSNLKLEGTGFIADERFNEFSEYEIKNGDILMSLTGNIGRVIEVRNLAQRVLQNYRVGKFEPINSNEISKQYSKHLLSSELVLDQLSKYSNQSAQANFGKQDMDKIWVPFPQSLIEQQKIAEILSTVDEKIEVIEEKISKTQELKKGLMQQLLTKGIGHNEFQESPWGEIPKTWKVRKLSSVTDINVGKDLSEEHFSQNQTEKYRFPVYSNTVDNKGLYGYYDFEEYKGDSVTVIGRGVGVGTAFPRTGSFGAIGRLVVLFPNEELDATYLSYVINFCVKFFTENSAIPQLTGAQIAKYKIPLPSLSEQKKIASILLLVDEKLDHLTLNKSSFNNLKKGLMQKLLTGKIRVNNLIQKEVIA